MCHDGVVSNVFSLFVYVLIRKRLVISILSQHMVHLRVHFSVPYWSVLQCEMLGLLCVLSSLCVCVLASGDVISIMYVVPDQSL